MRNFFLCLFLLPFFISCNNSTSDTNNDIMYTQMIEGHEFYVHLDGNYLEVVHSAFCDCKMFPNKKYYKPLGQIGIYRVDISPVLNRK